MCGGVALAQQPECAGRVIDTLSPPTVTIKQAVDEAIQNNLGLLAERVNLTVAEASLIAARLRPNPVFSFNSDHLDLLGTGFNEITSGGPPEVSWRVDVPVERGRKRELRIETANYAREIAGTQLLDSIRKLKLDVTLACIEVVQAKANLALSLDNLRTFEDLVRVNDVRVKAGSISPLELTRSQVACFSSAEVSSGLNWSWSRPRRNCKTCWVERRPPTILTS